MRAVAAMAAIVVLFVAFAPAGWSQVAYQPPVPGPVVRSFDAPATPYGPGHRGIDLGARRGTPVVAMADGVVAFAGSVAGTRWVSIDHADGVRTTYGPLEQVMVAATDRVGGGEVIGRVGTGAHGMAGSLHVGARRGTTYVDPLTLLEGRDLVPTLLGPGEVRVQRREGARGRMTLVAGMPPSPNHLIVLAGYGSRTGEPPLAPGVLGYGFHDASEFSYVVDADGRPVTYDPEHTWQRVHESALALRAQLRHRWAEHPGQAVDLVGHSLGGLVALYYLLVLHDPADPTLPAIGRVATIASPLRGTEAAAALVLAKRDPVVRMLVGLLDRGVGHMSADAPVIADLIPGSDAITAVREAWVRAVHRPHEGPLATGTTVMTMGALLDPVVPAHNTDLPGADHQMVLDTHGGAPTDAHALQTLGAYLAGQPLPPADVRATIAGVLSPTSYLVGLLELALPQGLG